MAMVDALITADDYFDAAAGVREPTQLIDGVIVPSQPKPRHQQVTLRIARCLLEWTEGPGFGLAGIPIDVIVDRYNVYAPDVWWVAEASRVDPDEYFRGVPDLAVEVRSPSTWHYDVGVKRTRYEQHGLPELWLVDTSDRSVLVARRSAPRVRGFDLEVKVTADEVLTSPLLPGFELRLADVLAG
ncbi:MAG TPA: Uma2 family endonuclease [Acidimicrobiales bacterium]|nr:Uma2 family endonuclease [Acidimicrobiales bacterium]